MERIIQTIFNCAARDKLAVKSMAEFLKKRYEELLTLPNEIAEIIDDDDSNAKWNSLISRYQGSTFAYMDPVEGAVTLPADEVLRYISPLRDYDDYVDMYAENVAGELIQIQVSPEEVFNQMQDSLSVWVSVTEAVETLADLENATASELVSTYYARLSTKLGSMSNAASEIGSAIIDKFCDTNLSARSIAESLLDVLGLASGIHAEPLENLTSGSIAETTGVNAWEALVSEGETWQEKARSFFSNVWTSLKNVASTLFGELIEKGKQVGRALVGTQDAFIVTDSSLEKKFSDYFFTADLGAIPSVLVGCHWFNDLTITTQDIIDHIGLDQYLYMNLPAGDVYIWLSDYDPDNPSSTHLRLAIQLYPIAETAFWRSFAKGESSVGIADGFVPLRTTMYSSSGVVGLDDNILTFVNNEPGRIPTYSQLCEAIHRVVQDSQNQSFADDAAIMKGIVRAWHLNAIWMWTLMTARTFDQYDNDPETTRVLYYSSPTPEIEQLYYTLTNQFCVALKDVGPYDAHVLADLNYLYSLNASSVNNLDLVYALVRTTNGGSSTDLGIWKNVIPLMLDAAFHANDIYYAYSHVTAPSAGCYNVYKDSQLARLAGTVVGILTVVVAVTTVKLVGLKLKQTLRRRAIKFNQMAWIGQDLNERARLEETAIAMGYYDNQASIDQAANRIDLYDSLVKSNTNGLLQYDRVTRIIQGFSNVIGTGLSQIISHTLAYGLGKLKTTLSDAIHRSNSSGVYVSSGGEVSYDNVSIGDVYALLTKIAEAIPTKSIPFKS